MVGIERTIGEKVEVHGLPVPKLQGDRRPAVEHEFRGHGGKLVPQPALRRREDIEAGRKVLNHPRIIHLVYEPKSFFVFNGPLLVR